MDSIYQQGIRALADCKWKEATVCFDKVVLSNPGGPDIAPAYVGLLCAKLRVNSLQSIKDFKTPPTMEGDFARALQAATGEYRQLLLNYQRLWAEAERKTLRHKKIKLLAALLASLFSVAAIVSIYLFTIVPGQNYNRAMSLFSSGQYSEAISIFNNLGDYKDSKAQINEVQSQLDEFNYCQAIDFLSSGNYDDAIAVFDNLGNYKDCSEKSKEAKYLKANALLAAGNLEEAFYLFRGLGEYQDSKKHISKIMELRKLTVEQAKAIVAKVIAAGEKNKQGFLDFGERTQSSNKKRYDFVLSAKETKNMTIEGVDGYLVDIYEEYGGEHFFGSGYAGTITLKSFSEDVEIAFERYDDGAFSVACIKNIISDKIDEKKAREFIEEVIANAGKAGPTGQGLYKNNLVGLLNDRPNGIIFLTNSGYVFEPKVIKDSGGTQAVRMAGGLSIYGEDFVFDDFVIEFIYVDDSSFTITSISQK